MATHKVDTIGRLHKLFVRLHRYQRKGANNLVALLTRYLRAKADYMASYINLVSERSGVSATGYITTTNADVMLPIVREVVRIDEGVEPNERELQKAWEAFIDDYKHHRIRL